MIQWKYSWEDGIRANTIGIAKNGDPVPKGTSYLDTGYAPSQIANAYGVDLIPTNGNGQGVTIAVVVAYGNINIQHDLNVFCAKFGLPTTTVQTYYPNGMPVGGDSGWASETSLDVEWAHAMAPGATIALIVDIDGTGTDQCVDYAVTNLNAKVVSMSYGTAESDYPDNSELTEDTYFQAPGVAYLAAAGDNNGEVDYPAASPGVMGVGGTTMYMNNGIFTEKAWNFTGGGPSIYEPFPSYQAGVNTNLSGRGTPDFCAVADPNTGVSVYFTDPTKVGVHGWIISGGTSASTPIWAGIMARRASLGFSNDGFLPLLYSKQTNFWPCKDITNGMSAYRAVKGYDLATGLGSPRADQLVKLDVSSTNTAFPQSITFLPIPAKTFKTSTPFKVTASATSALPVNYNYISGPATLSGNTVTLTGGGTVVLTADQSGSIKYSPAREVTNSFIVNPATQTITFPTLGTRAYATNSLTLNAKASSKLPIVYTNSSGPVSLSGSNTVTPSGVGTVIISASQAGSADYLAASKLMSFKVVKAAQKIAPFAPITSQITTNASFPITLPTASSGLPVSIAIKSGPALLLGSNTISLNGSVGTVVLTASQLGNTNYLAAQQISTSFAVKAH